MTRAEIIARLRAAGEVAREAAVHGHHPFGAVLVGPDGGILMRQGNIDTVRHAETELARRAAAAYPADFLWSCTFVTTGEPCAMCAGPLYWANIGRLVYGFEEAQLLAETGDHPASSTRESSGADGPCRRSEAGRGRRPVPGDRGRAPRAAPHLLATLTAPWACSLSRRRS